MPPDGHTQWTFFAYYPHHTLNLYKVASEPSELPRFGPNKPYLLEKFDTPTLFNVLKMRITLIFAHKMDSSSSLRAILFSEQTINLFTSSASEIYRLKH